MKILLSLVLVLVLLLPGPVLAGVGACQCASVAEIKANPEAYMDGPIKIRAFLVPTDHGPYLADQMDSSNVLLVSFSNSGPNSDAAKDLQKRLISASLDGPSGHIQGVFEGQLTVRKDGGRPNFEIYSDVTTCVDKSRRDDGASSIRHE